MIYDCTMFYNEFDLLELRLGMNYPEVDKFIIVESDKTFMGQDKELFFPKNIDRFAKYLDKIIYIPISYSGNDFDNSNNFYRTHKNQFYWLNEHYQRDAAILKSDIIIQDNDIIICSDLDELYNIGIIKEQFKNKEFAKLSMIMSYFYFNTILDCRWEFPFITTGKFLKQHNNRLTYLRNYYHSGDIIDRAGWHFSNLGDAEYIRNKCLTNAHSPEYDYITIEQIQESINSVKDIIDRYDMNINKDLSYLPTEITNNLVKWSKFIK
jgi:beta-1,4-mannosyl-glycoprotein beta-1,4-N-acetylglucosaminyltransferase